MKGIARSVVLLVSAGLASCGPAGSLGVVDVATLPPETATQANNVQILDAVPPRATLVGLVTATSCKNLMWQPEATQGDALAQLKVKAVNLGANAISGVSYSPDGTSLVTNCWSSVTATGTAVKVL